MFEMFNLFPEIAANLVPVLGRVCRKTAFDIKTLYQAGAPVDTGFMVNSCYVVTATSSTYGRGVGSASKRDALLPEIEWSEDPITAYVAVGAEYAFYVEMGTRFMADQPAFYPAVDFCMMTFEDMLGAIEKSLIGTVNYEDV